jgi:alpha-tubulin suppressor-like RCC1 family protein
MRARPLPIALAAILVLSCGSRTAPEPAPSVFEGVGGGVAGAGGATAGGGGAAGVAGADSRTGIEIMAGESHNCALADGRVKCWGNNSFGVLGLGDTESRGDEPFEMGAELAALSFGPDRTASQLRVGLYYGCVLTQIGSVLCWGQNDSGQLGLEDAAFRGDEANEVGPALPAVALGTGRNAVTLATGLHHTCALLDDGRVKCWGWNYKGELGLGDTNYRGFRGVRPGEMGDNLPALELGPDRVVELAAGPGHSCARFDTGAVKCWGQNSHGVLGLGDGEGRGDDPLEMGTRLPALEFGNGMRAVRVVVGRYHSCVLLSGGIVKCWGYNDFGQLGTGDVATRGDEPGEMGDDLVSVELGVGKLALDIAAGGMHSCALLNDGSVKCWGGNEAGQLGQGDRRARGDQPGELGDRLPPIDLGTNTRVTRIVAGFAHTCVLFVDQRVKCWGTNAYGELGLGDQRTRGDDPGEMGALLPAVDLAL